MNAEKIDTAVIKEIQNLKKKNNAVILAHNYQLPEIQDIADFLGDSFDLSVKASKIKADVIVFCGVRFMAETAKIISPHKKVLMPDIDASCPMADMITKQQLQDIKDAHPGAKVLCYVNSSAEVKSISDVCCTSANSVKIAQRAFSKSDEVIFVPDKYLALYTAGQTKRDFIIWDGYCPVHADMNSQDVKKAKFSYPQAELIVHPECSPEVIKMADAVCSTSGMLKYVNSSKSKQFIIGTEPGIIYRLKKENPSKDFYALSGSALCIDMKRTTLEKVLSSLKEQKYALELSPEIIAGARRSIDAMIKYGS
ncbi:MAG: quinolinate synthase NadA [Candidatus Omnitrophica bacterium]|nr:quinolinate synthase NadA [Candidatus Omnitrophota bacterium]